MLTVLFYGNSLGLSTLRATLRGQPELLVMSVDPAASPPLPQPDAVDADVVVFDMASTIPDALAFWKASPDVLLIGVDMASDTALVLSPATQRVLTTNDLLQVIRSHAPFAPRPVRRCRSLDPAAFHLRRHH